MAKTKMYRPLRDKALFLSDYWVALRRKPDSVKAEFLTAYCSMAFDGVETDHSEDCEEVFCMCRKGLKKSLTGYVNKCKSRGVDPSTGEVLLDKENEKPLPSKTENPSEVKRDPVAEQSPELTQPYQGQPPRDVTSDSFWENMEVPF